MASAKPCPGSQLSTPERTTPFSLRTKALGPSSGTSSRQFSSQYKGVVPQHNGKWGAQIYVRHQRLWLGTFNNELEAALAYDRACLKFRSAERRQNLLNGKQCQIENNFQELYSKKQVVQMIKDHSYTEKFNYFISIRSGVPADAGESRENINYVRNHGEYMVNPEHLFDKEVTPSDVGKLNRLVIPKQHAERNFTPESEINDRDETLVFLDENNKEWKFRYSFWKSSRSYVLTRGWSRFVKEKQLQAGNIVSFQRCRATGKLYISIPHHPNYLRPSAEGIGSQPTGRGRNVVYSSPFTTEASLVVNDHDWPLHFHNKSLVLQNHGTILPVPMGYYSEWIHGGTQEGDESIVEGRISNIDIRKETMELSLFPSHETQDGIGGRDDATVACQSRSRSYQTPHAPTNETISTNSIRLFGVEIGSVVQKQ